MRDLQIKRGDIFYIHRSGCTDGSEQQSGRPAVVISNDENNRHSATVEVVYCTTKEKPDLPTHTKIFSTFCESTVLCEQITTVSTERIGDYIGCCTEDELRRIDNCIAVSIGLKGCCGEIKMTERFTPTSETGCGGKEDVVSVRVQRDIYKQMYEILVDKLTGVATGVGSKR